jgi:hypothetical protein
VAVIQGSNFSSFYNVNEGTVFVNAATISTGNASIVAFGNTTSDIMRIFKQNGNQGVFQAVSSSSFSANIGLATTWTSGYGAISSAYRVDSFAASFNGGTAVTDTSGVVPIVSTNMTLGTASGLSALNGHIRQIAYYNTRLSNAQLQAITA